MDIQKLREEFEKLPEIAEKTDCLKFENGFYYSMHHDCECEESFVNGAWYAFQEQQKKIDEIVGIVREADLSNGDSSVAIVHDEIQELLK